MDQTEALRGVGPGVHGDRTGSKDLVISNIKIETRSRNAVPRSEAPGRKQEPVQRDSAGGAGGKIEALQTMAGRVEG